MNMLNNCFGGLAFIIGEKFIRNVLACLVVKDNILRPKVYSDVTDVKNRTISLKVIQELDAIYGSN